MSYADHAVHRCFNAGQKCTLEDAIIAQSVPPLPLGAHNLCQVATSARIPAGVMLIWQHSPELSVP